MAVLNFVQKGLAEPRNVWRMEEVTNNNKPTMPLLAGTNDQTTRLAQTDTVGKIEKWRPEDPQTPADTSTNCPVFGDQLTS